MSSSDEEAYEVSKILKKRTTKKGKVEYLIRWKGFSSKFDSWEPLKNLSGCQKKIREYNQELLGGNKKSNAVSSKKFYSKNLQKNMKPEKLSPFNQSRNTIKLSDLNQGNKSWFIKQGRLALQQLPIVQASKLPFVTLPVQIPKKATTVQKVNVSSSQHIKIFTPSPSGFSNVISLSPSTDGVQQFAPNPSQISPDSTQKPKEPKSHDHDYTLASVPYKLSGRSFNLSCDGEGSSTTEERKSTLRRGPAFQDRYIVLQWREKYVEIVFTNALRGNSLTPRFLTEISNALDAVSASRSSVVVIQTVGDVFCSGLDTKYLVDSLVSSNKVRSTAISIAHSVRDFVDKLIEFEKMIIAVVQGPAIGLGCSMLALFDVVYCSDRAWFWTPYTEMGQAPDCCSSVLFPEIMGQATANHMLMSGARLSAHEAKLRGLVAEVFPHATLKQNTTAYIMDAAAKCGEAIQTTKYLMRSNNIRRLRQANFSECNELVERWSSQEAVANLTKILKTT